LRLGILQLVGLKLIVLRRSNWCKRFQKGCSHANGSSDTLQRIVSAPAIPRYPARRGRRLMREKRARSADQRQQHQPKNKQSPEQQQ